MSYKTSRRSITRGQQVGILASRRSRPPRPSSASTKPTWRRSPCQRSGMAGASLREGHQPGIRPVTPRRQQEALIGNGSDLPAAFPLPAFASWSSFSRPGDRRPSRSAHQPQRSGWTQTGFPPPHAQHTTREGALYSPGTGGALSGPATITGLNPAHSQRDVPAPRHNLHHCAALHTSHHQWFTQIRPSGLPLACDPWMDQERLVLSPELSISPLGGRRTSGRGQIT